MQPSNVFSFWKLIEQYHIKIPIIQRDYAQGRKGKEVQHVRNEFLRVLFNALETNNPIELDFIYGTVNETNQFAPLDGQQRLTTLYLLHWYIALKEGKLDANQAIFQRFSYETRLSSKLFCKLLVSLTDIDLTETSLSNQIYNEANFYYGWAHDPTVSSMLTMLDMIHSFAKEYNLPEDLFEILTTNAPITFQFIDLDTFQLEDTLYIKMNARGKPLTPFENFKARFQQYLENVQNVDDKQILYKTDTVWSDFFWKHQKTSYDESFLHFFYALLYNQLARSNQNRDCLFSAINGGEIIRFDDLVYIDIDSGSWVKDIELTLDGLCSGTLFNQETVIDIKKVIKQAMMDELYYTERVQLYAVVSYIRLYADNFAAFSRWMRFVRNVTVNTIYNRVEDFMQSIQAIDVLITHAQNLDAYLADSTSKLTGFFGPQLTQEQLKARLTLYDGTWKEPLYNAEDYGYFEGDIGFLLLFIDINELPNCSNHERIEKQASFISYYEKAIAIFGPTKLNVPINLLSRALLKFGDYLIQAGQNRSFLIEGFDRDISWKRFLRHEKVSFLKELLDEVKPQTITTDLQHIIDESDVTDWRQYIIQYPLILDKRCGNRRLIRFYDEQDILLLDTTMTSGYCQEYYSYAIYAALQQNGINCSYIDSVGAFNEKYVRINDMSYSLNFVDKQFVIYDRNDDVIAKPQGFDEALEKMSELAGVSV
ncbi:DUF262 domain-containing protein [Peribacillus deserti]|uniref:GmrSD restriction endonucleases N-terminal domain-containing protein n=1 Tax=Peribacillus deserti TaxID=673318 RepID=A0A2N5M638_9BACI|nr:DUF262 domain-containing protein [Peribacillus deserti]PLT29820.1 hypothetical protein CUU66_10990 [Peribacillus deserti]